MKPQKNKLFYLIIAIFIVCLNFPLFSSIHLSVSNPDYTYYGVVPFEAYRYNLTDPYTPNSAWQLQTHANMTLLSVVASEDNTNFKVYNLTTGKQISEGHLNSMENKYTLLPNGTFFKVVSDKIVSVLLLEYGSIPLSNVTDKAPSTYYTSIDGLYVGKKFVFMVDEGSGGANDFTIFALEKSTITITKDDNSVNTISLDANAYKDWPFSPFRVYKIESTGNIMLWAGVIPQWGGDTNCFSVPCAEGGFVGKYFITKSITAYDPRRDYGYRISATEDAKVTVYDLETKQVIKEYDIVGGVGLGFQPPGANALFVQSDKPITLSFVHNGSIEQTRPLESSTAGGPYSAYGNAVSFIGVRANENTELYLPIQSLVEVYFFANQETHVTIDDTPPHTIEANNYFVYTIPGNHMISSDKDIMVEINYWNGVPYYQGIMFTGAIIPCIETVSINPNVTLTPIGEGFPMMYIIIGGGVAAVAVIVGLLVMRRRGGKPS